MIDINIPDKYGRFKDAPWFNTSGDEINVLIGGAGGIGSWLSLLLTRAGFIPFVYDFDSYEVHNIGGQFCRVSDIGRAKVLALEEVIRQFCDTNITIFGEAYTEDSPTHNYVFSGFDNMKARKVMYEKWRKEFEGDKTAIFIDGRLSMEQLQIYCVTGDKANEYEKTLFDDSEVEDEVCTMKQTSHMAAMIAAYMTSFFTNHITNVNTNTQERNVPFYTEYFSPIGVFIMEG